MKTLILGLSLALLAPAALAQMQHDHHHGAQAGASDQTQQARRASATGQVKAVDSERGTITIAHAPVPALRWPAMVMPFKATAEQIGQVSPGDEIAFEFTSSAEAASLLSIEKR